MLWEAGHGPRSRSMVWWHRVVRRAQAWGRALKRAAGSRAVRRSRWGAGLLVLGLSLALGTRLAGAIAPPPADPNGTVDRLPETQALGQEVYRNNCGTCHLALPPAVLPTESWRQQLLSREHYGRTLERMTPLNRQLVWQYLSNGSRALAEGEAEPYRVASSRYFKALHPRVPLEVGAGVSTCVSCHPRAEFFNFRRLTPDWDDAP